MPTLQKHFWREMKWNWLCLRLRLGEQWEIKSSSSDPNHVPKFLPWNPPVTIYICDTSFMFSGEGKMVFHKHYYCLKDLEYWCICNAWVIICNNQRYDTKTSCFFFNVQSSEIDLLLPQSVTQARKSKVCPMKWSFSVPSKQQPPTISKWPPLLTVEKH